MTAEWRLLVDEPLDGAFNMALDRSVQAARETGEVPPTLRLYRWRVPTITLGRFQDSGGIDLEACRESGVDVVRRSTGGRAVLHDDELTYSVIASTADGVPRGVAASYAYLSQALADAYRRLGVAAELVRRDAAASPSAACYLTATRADLSHAGAKLAGSAQVWQGSTVLQHGSFTRSRDVALEARLMMLSDEEAANLAEHTATLSSAAGGGPAIEAIAEAVTAAFSETLGITLRLMEATGPERDRAKDSLESFVVQRATGHRRRCDALKSEEYGTIPVSQSEGRCTDDG